MDGDVESSVDVNSLIEKLTKSEKIKVGEEWVSNTSKKWYKPWTWLQEKGYYQDIYEDRQFVDALELANRYFAPIEEQLRLNVNSAKKYAKDQSNNIKIAFSNKFKELDDVLKGKLAQLEICATDCKNVDKIIEETNKRLKWLENIQKHIEEILDI